MKLKSITKAFGTTLGLSVIMAGWMTFCYIFPLIGLGLMLVITTVIFAKLIDKK